MRATRTALHLCTWQAVLTGNPDVITVLLAAGADLTARNKDGATPLHMAAALTGNPDVIPRPRTSVASPEHRVFPYLLRGIAISQADHVWCADITYVPVKQGFFYLVAVMDWATRHVLAWRLSNTMDTSFCIEALDDALSWRAPEILNTDQCSQFTSEAFANRVLGAGVSFSMDGRGRFHDNIFIERL